MKDACFSKIYGQSYLALSLLLQSKLDKEYTWGLNWPGPGSSAANLIASSKLLFFIMTLSLFLRLENFLVPRSVYLVRSNLPTPGGLCFV